MQAFNFDVLKGVIIACLVGGGILLLFPVAVWDLLAYVRGWLNP